MQLIGRETTPIEGKWFEVNPTTINKKICKRRRNDFKQELTRQLILEAFEEIERNPDKYANPFKTMIPEKNWTEISGEKAQIIANQLEGYVADWVEQALEWAQRIDNGESWKTICNEADKSKYCRILFWKNGFIRIVGGSISNGYSASDVCEYDFDLNNEFVNVVPLIASKI